jgi:GntR family transcriptional repressor for pyruvate dehydrogenase complex
VKSRLSAVVRVSDAVAGELETRILEGSLRPGDRLPGERELSVELGVSRPSLREAIQKLVSKGLLTTRHGVGTFVTDRMEAPFVDPWQDMLAGHPNLQSDLIEFRLMLESHAAALAAERATDADIERLDAAYRALGDAYASEDMATAVAADVAFHQVIAEATHNVMIGHLTASLLRLIHGHVSSNLVHLHERAEHWELLKHQHREIWQAVRDHRADVAASAAREHIEFVRRTMVARAAEEERRHSAMRRLGNPVS